MIESTLYAHNFLGGQQQRRFPELIYNCQVEGERISEELTKNSSGAGTSAKRAYCRSRKASWRWRDWSHVPNDEEHLDEELD